MSARDQVNESNICKKDDKKEMTIKIIDLFSKFKSHCQEQILAISQQIEISFTACDTN